MCSFIVFFVVLGDGRRLHRYNQHTARSELPSFVGVLCMCTWWFRSGTTFKILVQYPIFPSHFPILFFSPVYSFWHSHTLHMSHSPFFSPRRAACLHLRLLLFRARGMSSVSWALVLCSLVICSVQLQWRYGGNLLTIFTLFLRTICYVIYVMKCCNWMIFPWNKVFCTTTTALTLFSLLGQPRLRATNPGCQTVNKYAEMCNNNRTMWFGEGFTLTSVTTVLFHQSLSCVYVSERQNIVVYDIFVASDAYACSSGSNATGRCCFIYHFLICGLAFVLVSATRCTFSTRAPTWLLSDSVNVWWSCRWALSLSWNPVCMCWTSCDDWY